MLLKYFKNVLYKQQPNYLKYNFKSNLSVYLVFYLLGLLSSKLYSFLRYFLKFNSTVLLYHLPKFKKLLKKDEEEEEEYKLVLCVRMDLAMGKGKIAAQCGHASIGAYTDSVRNKDPYVERWFNEGQRKVVLKINDYEEMKELKKQARLNNLNVHVTMDAGRTQIPSGSYTVIALGPGPDKILNKITGHLKLL